ncbi:DNA topoisomerase VI, b subunit, putative [Plasmodium reichenowi]|uniref:DNA topoisomerase VI, b subunit, putative n=1 Tax=Plasmodium reichenowi TaxID=5854 RepID=A0A060RYR0_PLARE|nr:DNA topoisomerase VI, b subunit, putative [Plasmodium reichenowi]
METLNDKNNSTYSFFFKNLSVTGFYEENALFMTVKELFDNSVDALYNNDKEDNVETKKDLEEKKKKKKKKVEIIVEEYDKSLSYYKITCRDNGKGSKIKDLEKFSEIFLTSKDNCSTSGKFGIGLKTILLYSLKTAYGFLHIKVKVEENKIWDFMLVMDKNLNHTFIQNFKEYIDTNWNWSVEISLVLKINNKFIHDQRIYTYIKLVLLWKRDINIKCIIDNMDEFIYTYEEHANEHEFNLLHSILNYNCKNITFQKEALASFNFKVCIYINVLFSNNFITNPSVAHIFLIRYVNSMPLFGNTGNDCSIVKDFKNFLRLYGPQYGMDLLTLDNFNQVELNDTNDSEHMNYLKDAFQTFYVKKSEFCKWNVIIVGIDIRGCDISYANLNKNCIKEGEYLSNIIKKCLLNLFTRVKEEYPDEFESISDYHIRQALDIYGVQLASSLSKIILNGRDEFKNKILFLLNEKKKKDQTSVVTCEENNVDKKNQIKENELTDEIYHHIREKVLSDEKVYEHMGVKNNSSDKSNESDEDDEEEEIECEGEDECEEERMINEINDIM